MGAERDDLTAVDDEVVNPISVMKLAIQIVVLKRADNFGLDHATTDEDSAL